MKYMMLIYAGEGAITESQREHCYLESAQLARDLQANGKFLGCNPLHPTSSATSVRVREGKPLVTDGPFAETREHLGGYFVIDAKDSDEAIDIAARIPGSRWGTVEVRPVREIAGLPTGDGGDRHADGATRKRYLLLCYTDEQYWRNAGEATHLRAIGEAVQLTHELKAKGQYLSSAPLLPTSTANSVRVREGKRLVTDGPFAETREQLGGYHLIDAKDLDEAIGIAARHPGARVGTVEIRPVMEVAGLPTG
jgi:hypothetical protein